MNTSDPIARAFELARSGACKTLTDIGRTLEREGYSNVSTHLNGPALRRQLYAAMKSAAE